MTKVAVYDIVAGEEVLYVGAAAVPRRRAVQHRIAGKLMPGLQLRVFKWCRCRKEALRLERRRIKALAPIMNGHGKALPPDVRKYVIGKAIANNVPPWHPRKMAEMGRGWGKKNPDLIEG